MVLRSLGCTSHDRQVTEANAFYGVGLALSICLTVVKFRTVSGWPVHHPLPGQSDPAFNGGDPRQWGGGRSLTERLDALQAPQFSSLRARSGTALRRAPANTGFAGVPVSTTAAGALGCAYTAAHTWPVGCVPPPNLSRASGPTTCLSSRMRR